MKISVITINFNNKEGLEKTIKSVINQTFDDFEYIVIDGGSTDGSVDVIQKYEKHINYWISEKDTGIYNAMNKGIKRAKGEYLHFLNSADLYYSDDVLEYFFKDKVYNEPIIRGMQVSNFEIGDVLLNNHGASKITFYILYHHWFCHQATFISHHLFKKYGLYDESYKIVADWLFFAKAILNDEETTYVDKIVALYDVNGTSSNANNTLAEKDKALSSLLPNSILIDYERLFLLEQEIQTIYQDPLYHFQKKHQFPHFLLRVLRKIYILFKL